MAGAGLRLGELRCWGRRAWPLAARRKFASTKFAPLNWNPGSRCVAQENILRRNEAKDNRKIPLVRSPLRDARRSVRPRRGC